jgi:glycosyltransferase involved in cell wall biosynthesis
VKVALFVRSLERGGAERQLVMLARVLKSSGVDVVVLVFYAGGPFEKDLTDAGIRVIFLGKASRWDVAGFTWRLIRALREERPSVLYGFVVSPNLLGTAVKPLFPSMRMVWGVRSARMDLTAYDWLSKLVYELERRLSSLPDLIIVNSQAGRRILGKRGFPVEKVVYVPNGIDVERYHPDAAGRDRVRREWAIQDGELLIGIVARADPVKAHEVFIAAAQALHSRDAQLRFVCVGVDEPKASQLRAEAARLGMANRFKVEGPRDDLSAVYSALDVSVMCSHSEGFPNVVAEAMACGVPCVVTDAGDAIEIVGETGEHAPVADPAALVNAIEALLARVQSDPDSARRAARTRIEERYSLGALAERTLAELRRL